MMAAVLAWFSMLVAATLASLGVAWLRSSPASQEPLVGLALLFPIVMALPLALLVVVVYLPAMLGMRALIGTNPLSLGLAGSAVAPVAGTVLLLGGRLLFANSGSIWIDLQAIGRDPLNASPLLLALVLGGIVFGVSLAGNAHREGRFVRSTQL